MCNISAGIEISVEKGRSDTILLMLNALMTNTSMPFEQAAKTLNVPASEWSKYKKLLEGGE